MGFLSVARLRGIVKEQNNKALLTHETPQASLVPRLFINFTSISKTSLLNNTTLDEMWNEAKETV